MRSARGGCGDAGCRKPGLTASGELSSAAALDSFLPAAGTKGGSGSARLLCGSSAMSAAVSALGDRFRTNSGNGGSRMCPPWSQLSISHVAQYVLRRPNGTATGLWLRQEVRGFRRSSVWEASLSVRKGMRGAAAGC
ncbi:hypothetical protein Q5P01_005155 [Channa striata]|uniref:Uncharacterized protein n=1 Tax=Channa striata TaxID=64152 RepID=A0AA88T111_CHASR|nr:hypothetical protein Q5P01_005155 [Channa striata]